MLATQFSSKLLPKKREDLYRKARLTQRRVFVAFLGEKKSYQLSRPRFQGRTTPLSKGSYSLFILYNVINDYFIILNNIYLKF